LGLTAGTRLYFAIPAKLLIKLGKKEQKYEDGGQGYEGGLLAGCYCFWPVVVWQGRKIINTQQLNIQ
jgi:hypothetical protein